jgi:Tol biopolymer transport system component
VEKKNCLIVNNHSLANCGKAPSVSKKFFWKTAAAGAVLAGIVLGGIAAAGWLRQGAGSIPDPAKDTQTAPAVTPERGIIIFQSRLDGVWQICSLDLFSRARTRLTSSPADDITPNISPDGSWIVFQSSRSGSAGVWRMRTDGTEAERMTDAGLECFDPCWGKESASILYSSRRSGREDIFAFELATRRERQITDSFWSSILPSISPDGSAIVFARNKLGWDVYRMNPDGSGITALTSKGGNCRPDWSPDGKMIAFVSDVADGKGDVWTMDADGGNKMRVTPGNDSYDYNPAWSPDGKWIVYETTKGSKTGPWSLAVIPAGGGTPAILTPPGTDDRFPDWAPEKNVR